MWLICGLSVPSFFKDKPHSHLPLIETFAVIYNHEKALKSLEMTDSLIITSKETVHYFSPVLKQLKEGKKVFCVGPATAKKLEQVYKGQIILPKSFDQEGLIEEISKHNLKTLYYPRALKVRPLLKKELEVLGFKIEELICYQTLTKEKIKMPNESISGYFFSSPSTVVAFNELFGKPKKLPIKVQGKVTKDQFIQTFGKFENLEIL